MPPQLFEFRQNLYKLVFELSKLPIGCISNNDISQWGTGDILELLVLKLIYNKKNLFRSSSIYFISLNSVYKELVSGLMKS